MTKEEFLDELAEVIDTTIPLEEETLLESIDTYDSIAVLSLMSWFDELGVRIAPKDFETFERVADLIRKAEAVLES